MMKKMLVLAAFMLSAVMAFATDPAQFLPADAGLVVYADGLRLADEAAKLDTSKLDASKKAKIDEIKAVLDKHAVSLSQIFNGSICFAIHDDDPEDAWLFFATSVPAESMEKIVTDLLALTPNKFKGEIVRSGKHVVYTFKEVESQPSDNDQKVLCFTYLANDVVLVRIMEADDVAELEKAIKKLGGSPLVAKLDVTQLVSVYCDVRKLEKDPKKVEQVGFDKLAVSFNLVGANQKDVVLSAHFACLNQEKLQQLGMQVNMMAPMMLGMAFGNDPSISGDLVKNFAVTADGTMLNASLNIPEALTKRIETYCSNPANFEPKQIPGAAQPGAPAAQAPAAPAAQAPAAN